MFNITKDNEHLVNVSFVNEKEALEMFPLLSEKKVFSGKAKELLVDLDLNNEGNIYLGINLENLDNDNLRMSGFNLGKTLETRKIEGINLDLSKLDKNNVKLFFEGLIDSFYTFDLYKKEQKEFSLKEINLDNNSQIEAIKETLNLMEGVFNARDLVNTAANDLYPESYSNLVVDLFKDTNVEVEVFNEKQIEELKMHALLEVARGSEKEPRFLVLKYLPNKKDKKHLTVVGKGVTYDSGGYAIKPAASMASMKTDMGGSASVIGLMHALNLNNVNKNVVGVIALTENMIDGKAYKNGDIINTMKGLKVEVINTDAEGRLTLADAIYYSATKLNSTKIIELSTLTGACVAAFGSEITGITTEDDDLYNKVHQAGLAAGEFNWRMPMTESLKALVKSDIADLKNAVPGGGGMMTAGIFLNNFNEDVPFIHLDIAGTSTSNGKNYLPKGATGVGVKTLYNYILNN